MTSIEKVIIKSRIFIRRIAYKLIKRSKLYERFDFHFEELLRNKYPQGSDFYFIQIGANDGVSHDWLYDFVQKRQSKGIVVEPLSDYFESLRKNYNYTPSIIPLRYAVHPNADSISLHRVSPDNLKEYPDWVSGMASITANQFHKIGVNPNHIIKETVPAKNLMNLIKEYYPSTNIDLFQVDVEGYDWEVLKMLDFSQFRPRFIKLEVCNLSNENTRNVIKVLKENGYITYFEGLDVIGIS